MWWMQRKKRRTCNMCAFDVHRFVSIWFPTDRSERLIHLYVCKCKRVFVCVCVCVCVCVFRLVRVKCMERTWQLDSAGGVLFKGNVCLLDYSDRLALYMCVCVCVCVMGCVSRVWQCGQQRMRGRTGLVCATDTGSPCRRALPPRSEATVWSGHLRTHTQEVELRQADFKTFTHH